MALLMEAGSNPVSESEKADLEAIAAIKESAAIELKEQGNKFVKMGKKHYKDAIDCYTRAINQKALDDSEQSILLSNRAQVNLLLGNYRRSLTDAEEAIKLCSTNVKAYYRAAKAAFSLNMFTEASSFCQRGLELEQTPSNEEMKKLLMQIDVRRQEEENQKARLLQSVVAAKELLSAIENRGLKLGKALYQELTGLRKPVLDKSGILHWSVVLLYAEVMSSDFIEDLCETDAIATHLDMMFSESSQPLPWDTDHAYTRESVELYYQAGAGTLQTKKDVLKYLLDGTVKSVPGCILEEDNESGKDLDSSISYQDTNYGKWIKVNEKKTLLDILRQPDYIIPAIPVFFVVSRKSSFYKEFRTGKWSPP